MRNNCITGPMIAREVRLIFFQLAKYESSEEMRIEMNQSHFNDEYNCLIKYANTNIAINFPPNALLLSLDEFGKKYILPKVKRLPLVQKITRHETKLLHMKRKLSCKSKIKIIH